MVLEEHNRSNHEAILPCKLHRTSCSCLGKQRVAGQQMRTGQLGWGGTVPQQAAGGAVCGAVPGRRPRLPCLRP